MKNYISPKVKLALMTVPGFEADYKEFEQSIRLNGRSTNTLKNYGCKLAELSLHHKKAPRNINETEVKEFLNLLLLRAKTGSQSEFKHLVYGLRYYYKILNTQLNIQLPKIPHKTKLPIVLSKDECRRLFSETKNVKHRLVLKFMYSGGLRVNEAANLKWEDIDFDRMMIHIKQGKGNKDRYVPLSANLLNDLVTLYPSGIACSYIFYGSSTTQKITRAGIRFMMDQAVKRIGLAKTGICLHTLRHSYATHLLEDGLDIISIKELLGHSRLETTLVYLHVSHQSRKNKTSPLDSLLTSPTAKEELAFKDHLGLLLRKKSITDRLSKSQYQLFE